MAANKVKITRTTLANFICKKIKMELGTYELSTLKERLKVPIKTMVKNGELEVHYELTEKRTNRAFYKLITNG